MKSIIRKATITDLEQLSNLFNLYRVFYQKQSDVQGAYDFLSARISSGGSTVFVSEQDGTLTGFVQLYPLFSSTRMRKLWLLNDLFVASEHRGKGLSVALIDRCKRLCNETDACGLMLETAKSNDIGNRLYPQTGFEVDEDHNYYSWDVS